MILEIIVKMLTKRDKIQTKSGRKKNRGFV